MLIIYLIGARHSSFLYILKGTIPGSPQRAFNPDSADGPVRVLAIGAPSVDDAQKYDPVTDA